MLLAATASHCAVCHDAHILNSARLTQATKQLASVRYTRPHQLVCQVGISQHEVHDGSLVPQACRHPTSLGRLHRSAI